MLFGSQNKLTIGTNFRYWRNSFSSSSSLVKVHRSLESGHGTTTCTGSNARSSEAGYTRAGLHAVKRRRIFHDTSPSSLARACEHARPRLLGLVEPRRFELLTFS